MSATTGAGNGKQPGLLSAMASLFREKKTGNSTKSAGGSSVSVSRQSEILPRSYGINRTNSERLGEREGGNAGVAPNKLSEADRRYVEVPMFSSTAFALEEYSGKCVVLCTCACLQYSDRGSLHTTEPRGAGDGSIYLAPFHRWDLRNWTQ